MSKIVRKIDGARTEGSIDMDTETVYAPLTAEVIAATTKRLSVAEFKNDPLFSMHSSFEMSLRSSAIKRHGAVIEAAILDALQASKVCEVRKVRQGEYTREIDVMCIDHNAKRILAFDVKRGNSYHDSAKKREMLFASEEMAKELTEKNPGYECRYLFLHYYSDRDSSHVKSLTIANLYAFTGVDIRSAVNNATRQYARQVDQIIRDRAHG